MYKTEENVRHRPTSNVYELDSSKTDLCATTSFMTRCPNDRLSLTCFGEGAARFVSYTALMGSMVDKRAPITLSPQNDGLRHGWINGMRPEISVLTPKVS